MTRVGYLIEHNHNFSDCSLNKLSKLAFHGGGEMQNYLESKNNN